MNAILFHPQIKALEAKRIVHAQGGRLVWRSSRAAIKEAIKHTDHAAAAIEADDYAAALKHMGDARQAIEGGVPCLA